MRFAICLLLLFSIANGWSQEVGGATRLEASAQRKGDAKKGYETLVYGDYVSSGLPLQTYFATHGAQPPNHLKRRGTSAFVRYDYNAVRAANGEQVVSPNCLQCHAQKLGDKLVIGLGNATLDFTANHGALVPLADLAIGLEHGFRSKELQAYSSFGRATKTSGPHLVTETVGVNPADKLAVVLAAHRNPKDLTWRKKPGLEIPEEVVPTDVPPWWHLKKKHAMFYAGTGRGDFSRIMMSSSLLTMKDVKEAETVDKAFADVLAYIETLEAPAYPEAKLNREMARRGQRIFGQKCAKCHGSYSDKGDAFDTYPNLLVSFDKVGTDPVLAKSYSEYDAFLEWYRESWFATAEPAASLVATEGYVAPPLDGVWATAPYLHNGSVPTLQDLLKSDERPERWQRSFGTSDRDFDAKRVGWKVKRNPGGKSRLIYDTRKPGYGNEGHTFGDSLSAASRADLIEYLKTL